MKDLTLQDPLHEILERHLFRSSTENETSTHMIDMVVQDYLKYLESQAVHIPAAYKEILIEDLKEEVKELTIRKTYGAISISSADQKQKGPVVGPQKKTI